ncbi:DNA cytosine methyltransferase [Tsukamurella soli]|uniref:DNA cytosine methyltransferase n=1 Tax=Tsukamurella soli TaxID=644556 RepID=UPI00361FDF5E
MTLRIGSLCTGAAMMDLAVEEFFDAELAWYSEVDKHASTVLAQRYPGIPNLGDLKLIDWAKVRAEMPIDILTGGYPCQPFSQAGKRLGTDDPRYLWPYIREAIRHLRPRITLLENVAGHRSKGFSQVLQECAEDGLDVRWVSVRASDVGAPHRRDRLFFTISDPGGERFEEPGFGFSGGTEVSWDEFDCRVASDAGCERSEQRGTCGEVATTPGGGPGTFEQRERHGDAVSGCVSVAPDSEDHGFNRGGCTDRAVETSLRLLPTPGASDATGGAQHPDKRKGHSQQLIDRALLFTTAESTGASTNPRSVDGRG